MSFSFFSVLLLLSTTAFYYCLLLDLFIVPRSAAHTKQTTHPPLMLSLAFGWDAHLIIIITIWWWWWSSYHHIIHSKGLLILLLASKVTQRLDWWIKRWKWNMDFLHAFLPISLSLSPLPTTLQNPRFFYFFFGKKENKTPQKIKILRLWIQYSLFVCLFCLFVCTLFACKIENCVISTKMRGNKKKGRVNNGWCLSLGVLGFFK